MPTPQAAQPATADDEEDEEQDPVEAAADAELDDLQQAEEDAAEEHADDIDGTPFEGDEESEFDVDLADTNVGDEVSDGSVDETPFSGVEEAEDEFAGMGDEFAEEEVEDEGGVPEEAIIEGAARLSVIGLEDGDEKESLRKEFEETFEAFQLGRFGAECAEEYLFDPDDDIDPIWGLTASLLVCATVVVWRRPDGDEIVSRGRNKIQNIGQKAKDAR